MTCVSPQDIVMCQDAATVRPAKTDNLIGAYIYPGWDTIKQWSVIKQRPYLGHYNQGKLETVDWFIKWAAEYGIGYFAFDWYWNQGKLFHNSNVEAFMKAPNAKYMKFCLHACNEGYFHEIPGKRCKDYFDFGIQWELGPEDIKHGYTQEDTDNLFDHVADTYFTSPSYLQIDGKMVYVQYRTNLIMRLMGIEGTRAMYERVRDRLRKKGFELYLVAGGSCVHPDYLHQVKAAGFDALTAYNWVDYQMQQRDGKPIVRSTYDACIEVYQRNWQKLLQACQAQRIDLIPPILSGFDNTPWSGSVVMSNPTPAAFETMCRNALKVMSPQRKMALICAWNEWGEGSVLEPTHELGFDYLNVVRRVFTHEKQPPSPQHVPAAPETFGVTV